MCILSDSVMPYFIYASLPLILSEKNSLYNFEPNIFISFLLNKIENSIVKDELSKIQQGPVLGPYLAICL